LAEVESGLQQMIARHFPVQLQLGRYEDRVARCKAAGGDKWEELFRNQQDRSEFVSLTGYVYSKAQTVTSGNLDTCLVFDRGYLQIVKDLPPDALDAFDFMSVIAVPVIDATRHPRGVLMALRRMSRGFIPEDYHVVEKVASQLSFVLAKGQTGSIAVSAEGK
jgi:hypothetical protein